MADFSASCNPVISPSEFKKSMSDDPKSNPEETIRVCVDLPKRFVKRFDELKEQWGFRTRDAVLERLLELVLTDETDGSSDGKGS